MGSLHRSRAYDAQVSRMIVFQRTLPGGAFVRQCLIVNDRATFLVLVSVCTSIKLYACAGTMPV